MNAWYEEGRLGGRGISAIAGCCHGCRGRSERLLAWKQLLGIRYTVTALHRIVGNKLRKQLSVR